jgi:hypothetical protein
LSVNHHSAKFRGKCYPYLNHTQERYLIYLHCLCIRLPGRRWCNLPRCNLWWRCGSTAHHPYRLAGGFSIMFVERFEM